MTREWRVVTRCGRNFGWPADTMDELFRDITRNGYTAVFVQPLEEYDSQFARIREMSS